MRPYLILIRMCDGSKGRLRGLFDSDWDAIDAVLGAFGDAVSVVPRREGAA
jgi:hypothetical protein